MRKQLLLIVSVILVASMLFGCGTNNGGGSGAAPAASGGGASTDSGSAGGSAAPAAEGERSKTFTVVTSDAMVQIDPHNITSSGDTQVQHMCYEPIIDTDHMGNYKGVLAESWEPNEDYTELTVKLRPNVTFQNGEEWNADQLVYNVERAVAKKDEFAPFINYLHPMSGATKVDDMTVTITFEATFPDMISNMYHFVMIPMGAHQEFGDAMFADMNQIGTGPWQLDEWVSGQYAHLTKNPNYWDKANYDPYFEEVYCRFIDEQTSAAGAHIAGDADAYISMGGIGYDVLALYAGAEDKIDIVEKTDMFAYGDVRLGFPDGADSVFYDPDIRKAMFMAIDRQSLADNVMQSGIVVDNIFPVGVLGRDDSATAYPEYNPEEARKLLEASSYDGRELTSLSMMVGVAAEDYALAIDSMLEEVGFNVDTQILDQATFNETKDAGQWDMMPSNALYLNGQPGSLFSSRFLADYMHANMNAADGGPEIAELLDLSEKYVSEADPAAREQVAKDACKIMMEYIGPEIGICNINAVWAESKGITGITMFPDTFWSMTYVDYDPAA